MNKQPQNIITKMVDENGNLSSVTDYNSLPDQFKTGNILVFSEGIYKVNESRKPELIGDWTDLFELIKKGEVFTLPDTNQTKKKTTMKYHYFICYMEMEKGNTSIGNAEVTTTRKIESMEQIKMIEKDLAKKGWKVKISIISYQLLRESNPT